MKLAIVIPAYNEEGSIKEAVLKLPRHLDGITEIKTVVVDDGSRDKTAILAQQAGAEVISHAINRGYGAALQTGYQFALQNGYDIVVTYDADGQHKAEEISTIINPILRREVEIVLGSRFLSKKAINISRQRVFVLKLGVIFTRALSNISITDTHNGFRAIHASALRKMNLVQDHMEHASEILDQISRCKIPFKEVPVTIEYSAYSKAKGQKNGNALKIAARMLMYKLAQ